MRGNNRGVSKLVMTAKYVCLSIVCIFGLVSILATTNLSRTSRYINAREEAAKDPEVIEANRKYKNALSELEAVHKKLRELKMKYKEHFATKADGLDNPNYPHNRPPGTNWSPEDRDAYMKLSETWVKLKKEKDKLLDDWDKLIDKKSKDIMKAQAASRAEAEAAGGGGGAGGGGHCFPADTLVLLNGEVKKIAEVEVGDLVMSKNVSTGKAHPSAVVSVYDFDADHYYLLNGKIKATGGESFYTPDGWKKAHDLKVGDRIHTLSGEAEEIVSKERITADLKVYNIRVDRNHTFFVSSDGETGYLVHNK